MIKEYNQYKVPLETYAYRSSKDLIRQKEKTRCNITIKQKKR